MPNPDEIQLLSSDDSETEGSTSTKKNRVGLPPGGYGVVEGGNPDEIAISPSGSDEERTPVNRPGGDSLQLARMEGGVEGSSVCGAAVSRTRLNLPRPEHTLGTSTLVGDEGRGEGEGGGEGKGSGVDEDGDEEDGHRWSGDQPAGSEDVAVGSLHAADVQGGGDCLSGDTEKSPAGEGGVVCGGTKPRIKRRNLAIYAATEDDSP